MSIITRMFTVPEESKHNDQIFSIMKISYPHFFSFYFINPGLQILSLTYSLTWLSSEMMNIFCQRCSYDFEDADVSTLVQPD